MASHQQLQAEDSNFPPTSDIQNQHQSQPEEKYDFARSFRVDQPKFNDIWAAILFLLVSAGFVAVSGLVIHGYKSTNAGGGIYHNDDNAGLNSNTVILFAFVLGTAFILSFVYFWIIRAFTKQVIWITGILQIVFGIGTAIFYFSEKYYSAAIVFLIFAIFYIICFISWIPRIPFSVLMLQTIIDVSKNYGHVFLVSLIGGLITTAFSAYFSVTLVSIYAKYEPGSPACGINGGECSMGKVIGLIVFVTFAAYWITEVIKNVIHVTISGVYGSWYFYAQKRSGFPKRATRGAFKRSMTYSFGSISFGSLLVAIIQFLRQACSIAQQNEAAQGNILGQIFFCLLGCFIGILDWAVQFINEYAFSYIALYGKAYIPAAKTTWGMMKDRGVDALVNECLINPVLTMGSVFVAYVCSFLAYLYLKFTNPAYNSNHGFTPVVMAFAFLIGLQICNVFLVPIKSGVATFFVAMAFDPEVLINDYPDLYMSGSSSVPPTLSSTVQSIGICPGCASDIRPVTPIGKSYSSVRSLQLSSSVQVVKSNVSTSPKQGKRCREGTFVLLEPQERGGWVGWRSCMLVLSYKVWKMVKYIIYKAIWGSISIVPASLHLHKMFSLWGSLWSITILSLNIPLIICSINFGIITADVTDFLATLTKDFGNLESDIQHLADGGGIIKNFPFHYQTIPPISTHLVNSGVQTDVAVGFFCGICSDSSQPSAFNFASQEYIGWNSSWLGIAMESFGASFEVDIELTAVSDGELTLSLLTVPAEADGVVVEVEFQLYLVADTSASMNFTTGLDLILTKPAAIMIPALDPVLNLTGTQRIGFDKDSFSITPIFKGSMPKLDFSMKFSLRTVFSVTIEGMNIGVLTLDLPAFNLTVNTVTNATSNCQIPPANTSSNEIYAELVHLNGTLVAELSYEVLNGDETGVIETWSIWDALDKCYAFLPGLGALGDVPSSSDSRLLTTVPITTCDTGSSMTANGTASTTGTAAVGAALKSLSPRAKAGAIVGTLAGIVLITAAAWYGGRARLRHNLKNGEGDLAGGFPIPRSGKLLSRYNDVENTESSPAPSTQAWGGIVPSSNTNWQMAKTEPYVTQLSPRMAFADPSTPTNLNSSSTSASEPEIIEAHEEEQPTDSHVLANIDHEEKGAAQLDHGYTEVKDLGWNEDVEDTPIPLVGGLKNEDLWTLIRRFNKQMYHVKALSEPPLGGLDLNIADEEEFSPDKLRANIERLYMTVIVGVVGFWKHIARLRSWRERKRTIAFASVYFLAWAVDFLVPTILIFLIVLIVSPSARDYCFPPAPIALINSKTGGIKKPTAGVLGSDNSLTGAPEKHEGEAVEQEASNFVNSFTSIAISSAAGKHPQGDPHGQEEGASTLEDSAPDPTNIALGAADAKYKTKGAQPNALHDKTKEPMSAAMWSKTRPVMHIIADIADGWERFGNALSPASPFPKEKPRLKLAAVLVPILIISVFTSSYMFVKINGLFVGIGFFSDPLIWRALSYLNREFPHWQKLLEIRNTLLKGVPTNAQLTITLLRIGEANKAPLPPPPYSGPPPPNAAHATAGQNLDHLDVPPEELASAIHPDDTGTTTGSETQPPKKHSGRRIIAAFKSATKGGVETILGTDRLKAAAGAEHAKNRLGVLRSGPDVPAGPVDFPARYRGKKGHAYITATATSPAISWTTEKEDIDPVWSVAIADIRELKKVGGLGWKTKLVVGWATDREIADGLLIIDKDGGKKQLTAIALREELFNRLIAMGSQIWEACTSTSATATATSVGSFLSGIAHNITSTIEGDIAGDLNGIIGDEADKLAAELGIQEWYSFHLMDMCEGNYSPNATEKGATKNVTKCSNATAMHHITISNILSQELANSRLHLNLSDIAWPKALQDGLKDLNIALSVTFVLYCIGIAAAGVSIILALLYLFTSGSRLFSIFNFSLASLSFVTLLIASAIVTVVAKKASHLVNKYGNEIGLYAYKGGKYLALTWVSTAVMFIASLAWIVEFFWEKEGDTRYAQEKGKGWGRRSNESHHRRTGV
ncbi:hypothetical protein B7494_g5863 [Chlorociboria aeruginascens]|nr:hypothetical protein B7494_g5863 [Chlorociboria aeruginascens]